MVAGEWGTMSHLQVYPTPLLNRQTPAHGGALRLSGYIKLDHKLNDVQGCDFVTKTELICASDDDSRMLFTNEKPLVEVDLAHALRQGNVTGHVIDLGSIPQQSTCSGVFEAEGVDYDVATGVLRVEIIQPGSCIITTTIYEYTTLRPIGHLPVSTRFGAAGLCPLVVPNGRSGPRPPCQDIPDAVKSALTPHGV